MKIFEEKSSLVINLSWDKEAKAAESFQIRVDGSGFFHSLFLPPATKLGQGNVFTGVCESVHRGGVPDTPPGPGTPSPWDQVPPEPGTPPGPGTPPRDQVHPPPRDQVHTHQDQVHPPPPQSMLRDTVNTRAVRILLECNLVLVVN